MPGNSRIVFLVFAVVLGFAGCAKPNYQSVQAPNPGNMDPNLNDPSATNCDLRFQASGFCLSWKWEEAPTSQKAGTLVFKTYRANVYDGTPVMLDFATSPSLVLWMPSMGHGSTPTTVTRLDVGTFRATNVFFIMPGEWQMRFQVKLPNEQTDEAIVDLTL